MNSVISQERAMAGKQFAKGGFTTGDPIIVSMAGSTAPASAIWVHPMVGTNDRIAVWTSNDDGTYTLWPAGEVTKPTVLLLTGAVANIKFQRLAGGNFGTWGIMQDLPLAPVTPDLTKLLLNGPWAGQIGAPF